jgi:hypothetical protein
MSGEDCLGPTALIWRPRGIRTGAGTRDECAPARLTVDRELGRRLCRLLGLLPQPSPANADSGYAVPETMPALTATASSARDA